MGWKLLLGALSLLIVLLAVELWPEHQIAPMEYAVEVPNLGADPAPLFPLDRPLRATLLLMGGNGSREEPYLFCLPSSSAGQPTCLFSVGLLGPAGIGERGRWYEVTASFGGTDEPVIGTLHSAAPATSVRPAGPRQPRQSRFFETSEAMSTWAVANNALGYVRTDGVYVWYLTDRAVAEAAPAGITRLRAIWTDA